MVQDGQALQDASPELNLQSDREFILAVVAQNADALQYAAADLKADTDFGMAVLQKIGRQHIWPEMRANPEFQVAVSNAGLAACGKP